MNGFKSVPCLAFALLFGCTALPSFSRSHSSRKQPIDYVNTLVGTAPLDDPKVIGNAPPPGEELYTGITSPGAVLPHGSTNLSPINKNLDLSYGAGIGMSYDYLHRTMYGFSTGAGALTVMPVVGDWTVPPERSGSVYDKAKEKGSPGYYSVDLDDYNTKVELTTTEWTGALRFTFPKSEKSHLIMDLGRGGGNIEIVDDHTIRGNSLGRGRRGGFGRYFVAVLSKPFSSSGTFHYDSPEPTDRPERTPSFNGNTVSKGAKTDTGPYVGVFLRYSTTEGEQVLMKVASGSSYEAAQAKLGAESPGWDFDGIHQRAVDAWTPKLNAIEVKGGTEHQRMLFYSNLFHSYASPRVIVQKGETITGRDGVTTTADYTRYGEVPFWDTGRDQVVLLTLLEPAVMQDIMRSTLDQAKAAGGWMPTSFHGDNAVWMFLGNWLSGVPFDYASAYDSLRKNAMDPSGVNQGRGHLAEYMEKGWISDFIPEGNPSPPYADGNAGAATTLEYSWDDWAMAQYAKKLGKDDDYQLFLKRAHNYQNVFDSSVGFMRGKTADGQWISPFDPREPYYNFMMKEASGWSTLWLVPHDVQGLINLLGGRDKFNAKLDEFFSTPYNPVGNCRDCTGVIGQYVQGNQPDQQSGYFYDWGGQPWKTQEVIRKILSRTYGSDKYGIGFPGMDDQGSTSSWYVLSALGFFPVNPASADYIIGSPIFDEATIHLGNGKDFVITAKNNSEANMYIQSATLNGKPLNKPWFSHSDIAGGGKLEFVMGPEPNKQWGSAPEAAPPSMTGSAG